MSDFRQRVEDFYKRYEHPTVDNITVGFSSIDPSQKALTESSITELTDTQINLIDNLIKNYLSTLQIHIDSGNVDPDTDDTVVPYSELKPSEIPHEELQGLLGGSDDGHYHLTKEEYGKLDAYPELDVLSEVLKHNELMGLQGGMNGDYYHLTKKDVARLQKLIETFISNYNDDDPTVDYQIIVPSSGEKSHEALQNLMGGNTRGHYHLTEDEIEALRKLKTALIPYGLEVELPEGTKDHEALDNLQGGKDGEHYHLTEDETTGVRQLINTLVTPDGTVELPSGGTGDHEELATLLGGGDSGHYHLTELELERLKTVLAVLYPMGASKPVFPSGTDYSDISGDPFAGLPKGTPPAWMPNDFPWENTSTQYTSHAGVHKMYYGKIPVPYDRAYSSGLFVSMKLNNNYYFMNTNNLKTWNRTNKATGGGTFALKASYYETLDNFPILDSGICQYVYNTIGYSQPSSPTKLFGHNELWCCSATKATRYAAVFGFWDTSSSTSSNGSMYAYPRKTWTSNDSNMVVVSLTSDVYCAVATSEYLDCALIVGASGYAYKKVRQKAFTATRYTIGTPVNPACAAWSPDAYVFCVTGPNGTATSSDGEHWEVYTDAPHNLVDMSYREDLHCFFARGGDDKLFYASNDGENWSKVNSTPIPLETVAAVDYNPDLQWYCAVGGVGKYAYFSKDLEHWVSTKITNGAAIEAGSVIWMPSTQKYVLMPTSGTYFYTFSPADWSDN